MFFSLCLANYSINKYVPQFKKVQRPRTRDLCIPKSTNVKSEESKSCRTNRIPSDDGGESISLAARIRARHDLIEARKAAAIQPGVEEVKRGLPFESKKSLSSEIIPSTVCTLAVSWK